MTEKENHLPNLSSEERAHALELAMQARRRYAALKARVKSGYRCEQGGSHHATVPDTERQACRRTRHPAT